MTTTAIIIQISEYIDFVEKGKTTPENFDKQFALILDKLAVAVACSPNVFDNKDYPDSPTIPYELLRAGIKKQFTTYGYYNLPKEIEQNIGKTKIIVGDAIDDIADIYVELHGTVWRSKKTSINDAIWFLRNSYHSHWGIHLRNLQRYVHYKLYES